MLDAYVLSLREHGVASPSTHSSRVAASVRSPFAAGALSLITGSMGPYHFRALAQAMLKLIDPGHPRVPGSSYSRRPAGMALHPPLSPH